MGHVRPHKTFFAFFGLLRSNGCRQRYRALKHRSPTPLHNPALRGQVPAKLAAETAEFDVTTLPALGSSATEGDKDRRAQFIANKTQINAQNVSYRSARMREIKDGLASDLEAHPAQAGTPLGPLLFRQ